MNSLGSTVSGPGNMQAHQAWTPHWQTLYVSGTLIWERELGEESPWPKTSDAAVMAAAAKLDIRTSLDIINNNNKRKLTFIEHLLFIMQMVLHEHFFFLHTKIYNGNINTIILILRERPGGERVRMTQGT